MESVEESIFVNEVNLEMAGSGKRLANYIIDLISFYVIAIVAFAGLAILIPAVLDYADDTSPGLNFLDRLLSLLLYGLYMGTVEAIFKGKSLGKLITGTVAVNEDGTPISAGKAFKRGLCRAIPFNPLSALGANPHPWHDRWTNTYVIDIKKSILPAEV